MQLRGYEVRKKTVGIWREVRVKKFRTVFTDVCQGGKVKVDVMGRTCSMGMRYETENSTQHSRQKTLKLPMFLESKSWTHFGGRIQAYIHMPKTSNTYSLRLRTREGTGGVVVTLYIRIMEISGSDLCPDTGYPDRRLADIIIPKRKLPR
jgi:hypothetical protein